MSAPRVRSPFLIATTIARRGLERTVAEGVLYIRREGLERPERLRGTDVLALAAALIDLELRCRTNLVDLEPWERALTKAEDALARCRKGRKR